MPLPFKKEKRKKIRNQRAHPKRAKKGRIAQIITINHNIKVYRRFAMGTLANG